MQLTDLGALLPSGTRSNAVGINDDGYVLGTGTSPSSPTHVIVWFPNGTFRDLGEGGAVAINSPGQVVGYDTGCAGRGGFLWDARTATKTCLGTLPGSGGEAQPVALNDRGQVVGAARAGDGITFHAFSWTRAEGMVDLGTLGGLDSQALAVNAKGQIIGWAQDQNAKNRAVVWSSSGNVFRVMTAIPGTWNAWLAVLGPPQKVAQLWSAPIPAVSPAATPHFAVAGVPPIGTVYALTALTSPEALCTGWSLVNTGP